MKKGTKVTSDLTQAMKQSVFIPKYDDRYVQWGNFDKILKVIRSGEFYPVWIPGHSGNGKSSMIEQACAVANLPEDYSKMSQKNKLKTIEEYEAADKPIGREYIRLNFTTETGEDDLLGSWKLVDGDTVFQKGPVVEAMERGAILLLDELDVAHQNRVLCLQSVLEGKGVLLKQTGEYITPAKGFNVFATSNTKGRGSDDGRYAGTNIMNGAFMDRFAAMIHQDYPPINVEKNILVRYLADYCNDIDDAKLKTYTTFVENICKWSKEIRELFYNGDIEEVVTTRTLINIVKGYFIFGSQRTALQAACEKYPDEIRQDFLSYYDKLGFTDEAEDTPPVKPADQKDSPF